MEISRKCDYACRIIRQAYKNKDSYISISSIADVEEIPYAFARAIQHDLVRAGFIETQRGVQGGLRLACDLKSVTMFDIVQAMKAFNGTSACSSNEDFCAQSKACIFHKVFAGADALLMDYFSSINLEDLFTLGIKHPSIKAFITKDDKEEDYIIHPEGEKEKPLTRTILDLSLLPAGNLSKEISALHMCHGHHKCLSSLQGE